MELGVKSVLIDVLGDQDLKGGCDRTEIWHFAAPETTEQPKTYGRVDQDPSFQNLAASPLLVLITVITGRSGMKIFKEIIISLFNNILIQTYIHYTDLH